MPPQEAVNLRQSTHEVLSEACKHRFLPGGIGSSLPYQHKGPKAIPHQLVCLARGPPDVFVVAEDNPPIRPRLGHPVQVVGTFSKVVVVPLEPDVRGLQDVQKDVVGEIGVYEEYRVKRRTLRR